MLYNIDEGTFDRKNKEIQDFMKAGDWHITEEKLEEFRNWPDNNYGYLGCVCYGNKVYDLVSEDLEGDKTHKMIDINGIKPLEEYCQDEFSVQDYKLDIGRTTTTGEFGVFNDFSGFFVTEANIASLQAFKETVVKVLREDKLLSKKHLSDYRKMKTSGKGFFMQVIKELDKVNEIKSLVNSADWQLNENAVNCFREERYGYFNIGAVGFGNNKMILYICESNGNLNLEFTHQGPLKEYDSEAGKEQTFVLKPKTDEMDPAFFTRNISHGNKEFDINTVDKGLEELKYAICNAFLEDGIINAKDTENYKTIRDNGTGYFKQVDCAISNFCKKLINKPKLELEDVRALAFYYDSKVLENLEYITPGRFNSVKRMLEDGLKPNQVAMIGSRMESVFAGDYNWAKDVLKSPEIQKFRQELAVKQSASKVR